MGRACVAAALALASLPVAGPGRAQEAAPNVITVSPSGVESAGFASLEERLERRLRRSNELLRSICVGCGRADPLGGGTFNPVQSLHAGWGAASQTLVPHRLPDEVIVTVVPAAPPSETAAAE